MNTGLEDKLLLIFYHFIGSVLPSNTLPFLFISLIDSGLSPFKYDLNANAVSILNNRVWCREEKISAILAVSKFC